MKVQITDKFNADEVVTVKDGAILVSLGESSSASVSNTNTLILASAARTATTTSANLINPASKGGHIIIDVTVAPGTDSIIAKIQGYDIISGKYYDILIGPALTATGITVLKIYPSILATPNASASDVLPLEWRVVITHSAATSFTYSVAANLNS